MYLNSASAAFKLGELNLWQVTFMQGYGSEMPLTRRYLYAEEIRQPARREIRRA